MQKMTDATNKIVHELYENARRFLTEDEIVNCSLAEKLSLFETNTVIEALIKKGVYISDNINAALKQRHNEQVENKRTIFSRKSPERATTFARLQIPIGSELTFLKDKNIVAITLDSVNKIRLKDGALEGSTSRLAQIIGAKLGYADVARQGPRWWLYNGKTLLSIREKPENE